MVLKWLELDYLNNTIDFNFEEYSNSLTIKKIDSKEIKNKLVNSKILDKYRSKDKPSDHVPVCLEMKN